MKKFIVLAASLTFGLTACGSSGTVATTSNTYAPGSVESAMADLAARDPQAAASLHAELRKGMDEIDKEVAKEFGPEATGSYTPAPTTTTSSVDAAALSKLRSFVLSNAADDDCRYINKLFSDITEETHPETWKYAENFWNDWTCNRLFKG